MYSCSFTAAGLYAILESLAGVHGQRPVVGRFLPLLFPWWRVVVGGSSSRISFNKLSFWPD
jgi:hypothetical protein